MATNKKAGAKTPAQTKFIFKIGEDSYQLKGKKYIFQGDAFNQEDAVKNEALCASLVASGSPSIEKV